MQELESRVLNGRAAGGISLIELLTALAIFSVLLAFGPPAYSGWMASQQLANEARHLAETLQLARSEAIKRGYPCKRLQDSRSRPVHGPWRLEFRVAGVRGRESQRAGRGR